MQTYQEAFTVSEVLRVSWDVTKKNWQKYLVVFALSFVVFMIVGGGGTLIFRDETSFLGTLLNWVVGAYFGAVYARMTLDAVQGKPLVINELLKIDVKMLLAALLGGVVFGLMQAIGFILLIIPGILVTLTFQFYIYSIVDKKLPAFAALEDSMRITKGKKLTIFFYGLVMLLIGLAFFGVLILALMGMYAGVIGGDELTLPTTGIMGAAIGGILLVIAALVFGFLYASVSLSGMAYMYKKMSK